MNIDKDDFFFCYDKNMRDFLASYGFQYITTARSIKNNSQFWLFVKSNKLQNAIGEFTIRKNPAKNGRKIHKCV